MEFSDVLDMIEADVSSARNAFNSDDGVSISQQRGRRNPVAYKKKLLEAVKFLQGVRNGTRSQAALREVMTTSDFPILFGDILDRTMLAKYTEWEVGWTAYARRVVVNDFREQEIMSPVYGGDSALDLVAEADQYPDADIDELPRTRWKVSKYGRRIPFSWETMINDNLGQLNDVPAILARAARRTENNLVSALFVGTTGPHATLYNNTNKNLINTTNGASDDNPPLSIEGLEDAMNVLARMVDESGYPILRTMVTLVVPPALEIRAKNIMNATEIETTRVRLGGDPDASSSGENRLRLNNWMRGSLNLVVDPYIPRIATTNGNTSWFLFANPNEGREAIRIGFLRGHEAPEIFMKSSNAVRIGGGLAGSMEGDFDTDSIEYKVRHVTGVALGDPKATVASNGTSS